eukprot:TRINITY_DN603_c0_g2_i1.p1 TRINITY_DN603_c0_g2~~TRINITY_DN603_c0_g2_i1.p1  ORF type:complete len:115 (-),score=18.32 TRINITY_DN603_c0_g2_i1:208-552(-)
MQSTAVTHYELYRKSSIGVALSDTLDELVNNGQLSAQMALHILPVFDKVMNEALATKVKTKANVKGHLHTYRFCDNVWTFILENAQFKIDTETFTLDKVKIVACDGRANKTDDV